MTSTAIPNRSVFRAQEVCEIAQVKPYVLRSWEAEFKDLGVAKTKGGPRVYRRADVERVLRLKHLLFVDGLTLAGARRRLSQEGGEPAEGTITDADIVSMLDDQTRRSLRDVRRGLQWILGVLSGEGITPEDRVLVAEPPPARTKRPRTRATARRQSVKASAAKRAPGRKRERS